MKKALIIVFAAMVVFVFELQSQVPGPLKLLQTIPLPGLHDGDFEQPAVDDSGKLLFIPAEDNSAVEVIDLRANKLIHTITGPKEPHSTVYRSDLKKLFVTDGDSGEVKMYQGDSYKPIGSIKLEKKAGGSIYDPSTKYMYVINGGQGAHMAYSFISVIDTTSAQKLADIRIDCDYLGAMALEKSGPRMFVNFRGSGAVGVGVIDREKRTVIATWSIGQEAKGNYGLAFDEANHRLFVIARDPGKLIVLDSDSGKIVTTLSSIGLTATTVYDPHFRRIYVSGVPFIYGFQQLSANSYQPLGQVPTAFHAITSVLVPQLNRYYLIVNHHGDTDAQVQVYQVVP